MRPVAILCFIIAVAMPALAHEEIRDFSTNVTLRENGLVDVTEVIEVNAEGKKVIHGIFRDIAIPLEGSDRPFAAVIGVVSVLRDGDPEPFQIEPLAYGTRLRIGGGDVLLEPGLYRYTIRYTTSGVLRHDAAGVDELRWDAIGTWDLPILRLRTTFKLPFEAVIAGLSVTGGGIMRIERNADMVGTFRSTGPLPPGDSIGVSVRFRIGPLAEPARADQPDRQSKRPAPSREPAGSTP